jgi:hypothetical protein
MAHRDRRRSVRSDFQNSRASRVSTKNVQAAWSSDWMRSRAGRSAKPSACSHLGKGERRPGAESRARRVKRVLVTKLGRGAAPPPAPAAERCMSARRLHRGQMRTEDPAFLVLHLDTDAAPAVDSSQDHAAPRRSDARADGLEAHTVAALELVGQCFRSSMARGTWCAGAALPPSGGSTVRRAHRHLAGVNFSAPKDPGDGVARSGAFPNGSRHQVGAASSLRHLGARIALLYGLLPAGRPSPSGEGERVRPALYGVGRVLLRGL